MITILDGTDRNPLQKIGRMAGVCWNGPVDDEEKNRNRALDCIRSGHGRVLEYVDIEMVIEGYSARCIREWYTHIAGGPTRLQESTRYVDCGNFDYYLPGKFTSAQIAEYRSVMEMIRKEYEKLLCMGAAKEDAANVLPLGMMTKVVDKRNLRNLVNLMNQRLCTRAYSEIRHLANEVRESLEAYSDEWKEISGLLFVPKCRVSGYCIEKKGCGLMPRKE